TVVVCPHQPREQLLQAACLAALLHAPLARQPSKENGNLLLARVLKAWHTKEVYLIGSAGLNSPHFDFARVHRLCGPQEWSAAILPLLAKSGPIRTLVITNPADEKKGLGCMSMLAPYVALRHHAPLLFTNAEGTDTAAVVRKACEQSESKDADNLLLVGDLK